MKEWQDLGKEIRRYVNAETFPVAVRILKDEKEIPVGTRKPLKDLRVKMAHCQAQSICRKYGWTIAMTKEDLGCAISGHTYGWQTTDPEGAVDFANNLPAADVHLLAPTAQLVVRDDFHPALIDLLLQAAEEVSAGGGLFEKPLDFPAPRYLDFPLSGEAKASP